MNGFTDAEWGLLVGLPQAVLLAASAAEEDSARRTAAENAAGMSAISDGRDSASELVRSVATEIVARLGDPDSEEEASLPVFAPGDPVAVAADALDRAKAAAQLLDERGHEADGSAYKHWLVTIVEEVVTAASSGGVLGIGGTEVSAAEQSFRDDLVRVLND